MAVLDSALDGLFLLVPFVLFILVLILAWVCISFGNWPMQLSLFYFVAFAILLSLIFPGVPALVSFSGLICIIIGFIAGIYYAQRPIINDCTEAINQSSHVKSRRRRHKHYKRKFIW